jgi:phosphoribosylpyrophosphate synthetase
VTDTVEHNGPEWLQLHIVSVGPLIAESIQRVIADGSMSDLF